MAPSCELKTEEKVLPRGEVNDYTSINKGHIKFNCGSVVIVETDDAYIVTHTDNALSFRTHSNGATIPIAMAKYRKVCQPQNISRTAFHQKDHRMVFFGKAVENHATTPKTVARSLHYLLENKSDAARDICC